MPGLLLEDGSVLLLEEDADATTPVTGTLVYSLPADRAAGTALTAVRQRVTVGEESDVRFVFDAAGAAALADDATGWTFEAEVAANTAGDPVVTPTVTAVSATEFEVTFAADAAAGLPPGVYVLSVYRAGTGTRTELARVVLTVAATAVAPP